MAKTKNKKKKSSNKTIKPKVKKELKVKVVAKSKKGKTASKLSKPIKVKKPPMITDDEILARLRKWIPKIVYNTTSRYVGGALASIFNEADMTALAEDTSLEVLRRVKIGLKNPNHRESVDLKGCEAYFKTAFKNQCLKVYEKFGKTDIRAGVQTIGSDEAMAVAAAKNLYSPEDTYLMNNQLDMIFDTLKSTDEEFNNMVKTYASRSNREVSPTELQHFKPIFQYLLDGYTAEEIETKLGITNSDFLRQKRLLFECVKLKHSSALQDMKEHFECPEDYRVHVRDVNKRQKLKQAIKDFKPKFLFYVHTTVDSVNKEEFTAVLYARIEMYDRFDNKSNKVPPKLLKIKEIKGSNPEQEMTKVKNILWQESRNSLLKKDVEKEAYSYLEEVKNKITS